MKNTIILILIPVLLSSCMSQLKVTVEVADRDKIIAEDQKYHNTSNIMLSIVGLDNFINSWKNDYTSKLDGVFEFVKLKTGFAPDSDLKNRYKELLNAKVDEITQLKQSALAYLNGQKKEEAQAAIGLSKVKIMEFENLLNEYKITSIPVISSSTEALKISTSTKEVKQAIEEGSTRTRFPILGDELTSFVAKNDNKDIWKSVFNKTVATTFIGNADVAMVLRSNPPERELRSGDYNNNFTIKGVRMDAADATNALVTGLTQTMNFLAHTQGIPMGSSTISSGNADNPVPENNTLVQTLNTDKSKLELKRKKLNTLKQMLIEKIELEKIDSRTTSADIKASAKRITTYWSALKVELNKP